MRIFYYENHNFKILKFKNWDGNKKQKALPKYYVDSKKVNN